MTRYARKIGVKKKSRTTFLLDGGRKTAAADPKA